MIDLKQLSKDANNLNNLSGWSGFIRVIALSLIAIAAELRAQREPYAEFMNTNPNPPGPEWDLHRHQIHDSDSYPDHYIWRKPL